MMDEATKQRLDQANKLIFVKRYKEAEELLEKLVQQPEQRQNILVQLRRIELATMLKSLDDLRQEFISFLKQNPEDVAAEICLALVEQHGEMVSPTESITSYQNTIKNHGPNAAAYFGIAFSMEVQGNYDRAVYNYEQSIAQDPDWYPSYFGLSQVCYNKGDEKQGDHYFYLFEQASPYNVYGNFETHRNLSREFLEKGQHEEAEAAIQALSEWWQENRNHVPTEIQIYEHLAIANIHQTGGDRTKAESQKMRARVLANQTLDSDSTSEGTRYFIARVLEEFGEVELAYSYYKKILREEGSNPTLVQKIGSQFLSTGEYHHAKELFLEAYQVHPDNPEVRFCLLVSKLKLAEVNVEDYLIGRERLRQLIEAGDKVELLALLHSLLAKFQEDPDVHGYIADVYLRLGNIERAGKHYSKMYEIDSKCRKTALKYSSYLMQYDDADEAMTILDRIPVNALARDEQVEVFWLQANYHARRHNYSESLHLLRKVLRFDPWNVSYLVQQVIDLTYMTKVAEPERYIDKFLYDISATDESKIDWEAYDRTTSALQHLHHHELVYVRSKLRFLYSNGDDDTLMELIKSASEFDASQGTYDLMRLLNTNFDSPTIYWALGILFKELWQLETAAMWLEQVLLFADLSDPLRAKTLLELSDCYIWGNRQLTKAIEYAKVAMDLGKRSATVDGYKILAHAFLKTGKIREAKVYLEQADSDRDVEVKYLRGLVLYRNGSRKEANQEWKPLLTHRTENLRFHNIKQEILKYYFEGEPYLKVN